MHPSLIAHLRQFFLALKKHQRISISVHISAYHPTKWLLYRISSSQGSVPNHPKVEKEQICWISVHPLDDYWYFRPVFYISVTHSFVFGWFKIEAHHSILKIRWKFHPCVLQEQQPWSEMLRWWLQLAPWTIHSTAPILVSWASFHCSWLRSHYLKLTKPWAPVPAQRVGVSEEKLFSEVVTLADVVNRHIWVFP